MVFIHRRERRATIIKNFFAFFFLFLISHFLWAEGDDSFRSEKFFYQGFIYFDDREYAPDYQYNETLGGGRIDLFYEFYTTASSQWSLGYTLHKDFGERSFYSGSNFILKTFPDAKGGKSPYRKPKDLFSAQDSSFVFLYKKIFHKDFHFYLGFFERPKLHTFLWDTKLTYYRPYGEGFQIVLWNHLFIFLDWMSRQNFLQKESFLAGLFFNDDFSDEQFGFEQQFVLHHDSWSYNLREPVWDNASGRSTFFYRPFVINNKKDFSFLAGSHFSWLRLRKEDGEIKPFSKFGTGAFLGFLVYFYDFYFKVNSEYSPHGQYMRLGDGIQQTKSYHRMDFGYEKKDKGETFHTGLVFHLDQNQTLSFQIEISANLDRPKQQGDGF